MVLLCMNCVGRSLPVSAECVSANSCEWLDFHFLRHRIQEEAKPTGSINATKDGGCFWHAFRVRFVLFLFGTYVCCKQKTCQPLSKLGRLHSEYDDLHAIQPCVVHLHPGPADEKRGLKGMGISWNGQMTSAFPIVSLHTARLVQSGIHIVNHCARTSLSEALLHFVNYHSIRTWLHLALCQLHMNTTGEHVRRILFELIGA